MSRTQTIVLSSLAWLGCCLQIVAADNWPQWRGPQLNGSSAETLLPDRLDPAANLVWKAELPGHGSGTPVTWDERLFITSLDAQTQKLLALCFDMKTGKLLWKREVGDASAANQRNNMAAPSPITDGKTVWFYFGSGDLAAFDIDGNPRWARNIQKDHGNFNVQWIYGSSPLLYNGKLYVQVIHRDVPTGRGGGRGRRGGGGADQAAAAPPQPPAGADSYLLAINPDTGKDLWKQVRPSNARAESKESYATPIPYEAAGRKEIIIVGGDCVTGHDADSGQELWRLGGWNPQFITHWRLVPAPVILDDKVVICTPKAEGLVIAIKPGGSGDITSSHKAWQTAEAKSDVPVPLVYQGSLYVLDGDFRKGIACMEPSTGKIKWTAPVQSRSPFRTSPTGADGKIFLMNEDAEVWVLSAADGKVLSHTTLATEGQARGSIVAAQGGLFVRTGNMLYRFGRN